MRRANVMDFSAQQWIVKGCLHACSVRGHRLRDPQTATVQLAGSEGPRDNKQPVLQAEHPQIGVMEGAELQVLKGAELQIAEEAAELQACKAAELSANKAVELPAGKAAKPSAAAAPRGAAGPSASTAGSASILSCQVLQRLQLHAGPFRPCCAF